MCPAMHKGAPTASQDWKQFLEMSQWPGAALKTELKITNKDDASVFNAHLI